MLARLSGGECHALPALLEEDEEGLTEESVTVLLAFGSSTSLGTECSPRGGLPSCPLRRAQSDSAMAAPASCAPRRATSEPRLPTSTPCSSPTPTLTPNTWSLSTACAEALESAVALCKDLDEHDQDRTLSVSVDEDMVFDEDFLALCSEATRLADTLRPSPSPGPSDAPSDARWSRFDINSIFDNGGPEPPRPPARKRRKETRSEEGYSSPVMGVTATRPPSPLWPPHAEKLDDAVVERRRMQPALRVVSVGAQCSMPCSMPCVQSSELILMTRASERTLLKRSRSVSAADRPLTPSPSGPVPAATSLCASSPELSSPKEPFEHAMAPESLPDTPVCIAVRSAPISPCVVSDTVLDFVAHVAPAEAAPAEAAPAEGASAEGAPAEAAPAEGAPAEGAPADNPLHVAGQRRGSVSSDVLAWQSDLLWAARLSDSDDGFDDFNCLETKQWFSSSDNKGRVYFFEENSNESSWNLPDVNSSTSQKPTLEEESTHPADYYARSVSPIEEYGEKTAKAERSEKQEKLSLRTAKSRSMVIVDTGGNKDSKSASVCRNWPQLFDGDMYVLKEGPMYRTKITENGKKLRKNWASSHVVLTELFLLLFRDAKSFAAMKSSTPGSSAPRPEMCVDLNGALIDHVDRGDKASVTSRKNVFLVSTFLGLQVLFQCDCSQQAEEWYNAIHAAIHNLPSGFDSCPRMKGMKEMDRLFAESNSPEQTKKFPRIGRSKSVKIKNKDGSIEDLTVSVAERQTKIKARLKKFFNRRPTMESLVKKGIWKDEPAFGGYLDQVCGSESPKVPLFVQHCIAVIESSEDNMKTDGLYRASGNLSQVQKIRLQVDQNNLSALDQEEDVHVLTGALKLFFRELKEPLIPYAAFNKAIKASTIQNKKEKLAQFRDIVKSLPIANHDTLKVLLKHLLKVTGYQEFNRMHIPNLAIVFGPTLMWPEQESLNMALDLMQQNLVIEAFLLDFDNIFR